MQLMIGRRNIRLMSCRWSVHNHSLICSQSQSSDWFSSVSWSKAICWVNNILWDNNWVNKYGSEIDLIIKCRSYWPIFHAQMILLFEQCFMDKPWTLGQWVCLMQWLILLSHYKCKPQRPTFHDALILLHVKLFHGWTLYFEIMSQCDAVIDLILNVDQWPSFYSPLYLHCLIVECHTLGWVSVMLLLTSCWM